MLTGTPQRSSACPQRSSAGSSAPLFGRRGNTGAESGAKVSVVLTGRMKYVRGTVDRPGGAPAAWPAVAAQVGGSRADSGLDAQTTRRRVEGYGMWREGPGGAGLRTPGFGATGAAFPSGLSASPRLLPPARAARE